MTRLLSTGPHTLIFSIFSTLFANKSANLLDFETFCSSVYTNICCSARNPYLSHAASQRLRNLLHFRINDSVPNMTEPIGAPTALDKHTETESFRDGIFQANFIFYAAFHILAPRPCVSARVFRRRLPFCHRFHFFSHTSST